MQKKNNKENYVEAKKNAGTAVYQAQCIVERKKIAKGYAKEQFIRNNDGVLAVSDEDEKIARKSCHKKLLKKVCLG